MAASRAIVAALLGSTRSALRSPYVECSSNAASSSGSVLSRFFSGNVVSTGAASHGDFAQLMKLLRQSILMLVMVGSVRCYAKRAKKWQGLRMQCCLSLLQEKKFPSRVQIGGVQRIGTPEANGSAS